MHWVRVCNVPRYGEGEEVCKWVKGFNKGDINNVLIDRLESIQKQVTKMIEGIRNVA